MVDRTEEWAQLLRSARPHSSKPITNILPRRKAAEGSATQTANALVDGMRRTVQMMNRCEGSYTALRGGMGDAERDDVDATVQGFLADCDGRIDALKKKIAAEHGARDDNVDEKAHLKGMVMFLLERYQDMVTYFQLFKSFRSKLRRSEYSAHAAIAGYAHDEGCNGGALGEEEDHDAGLSAEEVAQLEKENAELMLELDSKLEQLRNAEREMSVITSMCELTSHKIQEQAQEIDSLFDTVVQAVEDIDLGNIQLQKAAEASVSSRVFMLVFLFVASLALLFLHWYID